MQRAVEGVCDAHSTVLRGLPFFVAAKAQFSLNLANITAAIGLQNTGTEGATTQKEIYRNGVETDLLRLAAAVRVSSSLSGNEKGAREATITPSGIDVMGDNAFLGLATRILGAANVIGAAGLTPFGVDAAFLGAFARALDMYRTAIDDPRHAEAEQMRGTAELARLLAENDAVMEDRMDPGTELLKATQPGFYTEYWVAREIEDEATTPRALQISVTDTHTGMPLANVSITIMPGGVAKTTGPSGQVRVQTLAAGNYSLKLVRGGYTTHTEQVIIVDGERADVVVQMLPG